AKQQLWGAEIGPVWRWLDNGGRLSVDALAAFQYLNLRESLEIASFSTARGGTVFFQGRSFPAPATTTVTDLFKTNNDFFGGTVGLRANVRLQAITWSFTGKIGLGNMNETVQPTGTSTLASGTATPLTTAGGFFATGANLATFTK